MQNYKLISNGSHLQLWPHPCTFSHIALSWKHHTYTISQSSVLSHAEHARKLAALVLQLSRMCASQLITGGIRNWNHRTVAQGLRNKLWGNHSRIRDWNHRTVAQGLRNKLWGNHSRIRDWNQRTVAQGLRNKLWGNHCRNKWLKPQDSCSRNEKLWANHCRNKWLKRKASCSRTEKQTMSKSLQK